LIIITANLTWWTGVINEEFQVTFKDLFVRLQNFEVAFAVSEGYC